MIKRYVVIEDFKTHDYYSVLSKKEYNQNNMDEEILFTGSAETCNTWILDNPHPQSIDYGIYFDDENDDVDLNDVLFI